MHDDTALTVDRTRRVLNERVRPAIHAETVPLTLAASPLPGEPVPPAEGMAGDYAPFAVGTPWGPAWGTTWFRLRGTVPQAWAGRRVEALIDPGFDPVEPGFQAEGLVYRPGGEPVKSINPRNHWVPIADAAAGGEDVELFVEAASNPVVFGEPRFSPTYQGDILTASREPLYTFRRADLAVMEPDVFELALDLEVLLELQAELPATSPRRMRILQALDDALDRLDLQRIAATASEAREPLAGVLASTAEPSAHRLSAVGHAHIDSAWLWPVRETIRKVARTTASMTELIASTDDFVYGMSSAQQYKWIKEHRPEVYAKVRDAVAAGRFLPLGGMWVESDTTMPSGEAMARQFLYGQRFFEAEFGVRSRGVWLPDSFGYSAALPQLMRRAGFEWFFTQKISWNQVNRFPHHTFAWEGIDGSRMFSHFPPMDTYNSRLSGEEVARATRQFRESRRASGSIAPVGWGDGGGGTTREMVGVARRLADLEGSARVAWESPDDFYERAKAELPNPPVWVGELYLEMHRATLTSQHGTKAGNRRCEQLLVEAELWCATASVRAGVPYPHDALDSLWEQVLLQQFHDILPGSSIAWVHREAVAQYARVESEALALIETALAALGRSGDGREPDGTPSPGRDSRATDAVGAAAEVVFNASPFPVAGVPALGAGPARAASGVATLEEGPDGWVLANELVRVAVDREGLITSAVDLMRGRELLPAGEVANLLQFHQDFPNQYDAWDVDRFYRNSVRDLRDATGIDAEVVDGTPTLRIARAFGDSRTEQVLRLAPGSRTLEFEQVTDWHETEKFLKVAFPLAIRAEHTLAETQFGAVRRVTHTNTSWEAAKFETSMHRYVLASEEVTEPGGARGEFGAALVTDSTYAFDVTRDSTPEAGVTTTLRLSLLRAPRYPDPETDQGVQRHRYGLVIGADLPEATRAGYALNSARRPRAGVPVAPLVAASEGIVVSAVKLAADRSGDLIVRVYEPYGRRVSGELRFGVPVAEVREASLIEDALTDASLATAPAAPPAGAPAAPRSDAPMLELSLTPFEVRTYRVTLPPCPHP